VDTPTLNVPLAKAILRQITEHPETHEQSSWMGHKACGTTHCIAGWAAALTPDIKLRPIGPAGFMAAFPDGEKHVPSYAGQILLGLTDEQADDLFYEGNSGAVEYLRELIDGAAVQS
jgi:hypothetical protein